MQGQYNQVLPTHAPREQTSLEAIEGRLSSLTEQLRMSLGRLNDALIRAHGESSIKQLGGAVGPHAVPIGTVGAVLTALDTLEVISSDLHARSASICEVM